MNSTPVPTACVFHPNHLRLQLLPLLLLLAVNSTLAQPDVVVSKLVFEPVPLDAAQAPPDRSLVSFSSAESTLPAPAADDVLSSEERAAIEAEIDRYLAVVGESEIEEGPYSDQLREDLFETGLLYQQIDEHENALRLMERTLAVSRINYGLESLDQVPVMEAMALSNLALERTSAADELMDAAFNLQYKLYGDGNIELVPALIRLGDWNTDAFMDRSSILVNIPRMNVQNFLNDPRNYIQPQDDMRNTPLFKLYQARSNYLNSLNMLIDAQAFTHPELLSIERKLLTNFFLVMHRENILYEPDFYLTRKKTKTASRLNQNAIEMMNSESYDLGKEAHKRSLSYIFHNPEASPTTLARAMLEEADWDLLFERKTRAADKYNALYAYFDEYPELEDGTLNRLYPAIPVVLPTYLPAPNSREKLGIAPDAEVSFFGYIDVSFSINKYGKARNVEILQTGGEVTSNMQLRMNQYLRNVLFRPRYEGTEVNTDPLRIRYYIGI